MSDPQEQASEQVGSKDGSTSAEIARSLGSVWQRFSGQRPKSTTVEMEQHVVRCVIEEGTPEPEAEEDGAISGDPRLSPAGFQHQATAAIARATGRRVVAFIPNRDKKTETSTQTFILDRPRQRF
jgi:hypothetical protein